MKINQYQEEKLKKMKILQFKRNLQVNIKEKETNNKIKFNRIKCILKMIMELLLNKDNKILITIIKRRKKEILKT